MSWSPVVYVSELKPWPDSVRLIPDCFVVVRGRAATEIRYLPERKARKVTVWTHDTDHATGHTECSECKGSVNPSAKWCEHCGAKFEG